MKVLDLFSGLNGWSGPWKENGHDTFAIDIDERFDADAHIDIWEVDTVIDALPWIPDVILASPACNSFSMMSIRYHWTHDGLPKSETAEEGQRLVLATRYLIDHLKPKFWIVENPRARLRSIGFMDWAPERRTVTYCQYGTKTMKPTDLWGGFPPSLQLRPACKNGDPCHIRAPRGSSTGTQGKTSATLLAKIPEQLSLQVMEAAERDIRR